MKRSFFKGGLVGLLLLAGLAYIMTHDVGWNRFLDLLSHLHASWIVLAVVFQFGTYVSLALVWYRGLHHIGVDYPLIKLVPLAIAKLFADQALPSGGISGIAFVVKAFRQRDVSGKLGMAVMLLGILSNYIAYMIVAAASFFFLWRFHDLYRWMVLLAGIFLVVAVFIPALALSLNHWGGRARMPAWLFRLPFLSGMLHAYAGAPDDLVRKPLMLAEATLFQTAVFLLDAGTLWAMLQALGTPASMLVALPCFVVASIVALLSMLPLGLGSFELTCVALLATLGVPLDKALAATFLLRGFTLWLPMLPGLLVTRNELG
ncbi:MAG: flippase-like domain-containing protein [Chlorobiaceae bacterium]|nr:flippase-like domain-containing protein [Chlorobiaceae bacterium]